MMKIPIFLKSYIIKASSVFILAFLILGSPTIVSAGVFGDFINILMGQDTQAAENSNFGTDDFNYNSQNMQVVGGDSMNPNTKKAIESSSDIIVDESGVISSNYNNFIGKGLENSSNGDMAVYIVKEGDTLSEIAELHDVSTNTIKWENNLTGQTIKIGQKLNILPVTGVSHTIVKGDNLDKIAAKYEAEVEDIMIFNDITRSSVLKTGDVFIIPNGIIKAVVAVVTKKPSGTKNTSYTPTPSSSSNIDSGYYLRPSSGIITSPYGPRKGAFHYGVDIGNARGTAVVAAASGTVIEVVSHCVEGRSSCGGRYGNYIVIEHSNGTFTRYAHLAKARVSKGQQVSRGEMIGTIGNTGRSSGPHLHVQIEKSNGSTINPRF